MKWLRRLFSRCTPTAAAEDAISDGWMAILDRSVPFAGRLPEDQLRDLLGLMRCFVGEKRFWGSRGLVVIEEMKVVVAAYACLLVLRLPEFGLYPRTPEVILYPGTFGDIIEAVGPDGRRYAIPQTRIGQAIYKGPVLLAWDSVATPGATRRGRRNVIIHEFAHALDFLNDAIDGTPPLASNEHAADWAASFTKAFERLAADTAAGRYTVLDPYGATNPAEFFAVASECFFEQPRELLREQPDVYEQLRAFYRQDPAAWPG